MLHKLPPSELHGKTKGENSDANDKDVKNQKVK